MPLEDLILFIYAYSESWISELISSVYEFHSRSLYRTIHTIHLSRKKIKEEETSNNCITWI